MWTTADAASHGHDSRAGAGAHSRGARARLPEPFDRERRAVPRSIEMLERDRRRALDPVADGEVVHPHAVVRSRPERRGLVVRDEAQEVVRVRAHVGPGQEGVAQLAEPLEVGVEQRGAIAAREADAGLRPRDRERGDRELPRHRTSEPCDLVRRDVRDHARPARGHREQHVVDDDDRVEPDVRVGDLEDARGRRVLAIEDRYGSHSSRKRVNSRRSNRA